MIMILHKLCRRDIQNPFVTESIGIEPNALKLDCAAELTCHAGQSILKLSGGGRSGLYSGTSSHVVTSHMGGCGQQYQIRMTKKLTLCTFRTELLKMLIMPP